MTPARGQSVVIDPLASAPRVDVRPGSEDQEIAQRLLDILRATEWFVTPSVEVRNGVVFLRGQTNRQEHRRWAGDLARNTVDVVAVVNEIELSADSWFQFTPALDSMRTMWRNILGAIPNLVFGFFILILAWIIGRLAARGTQASIGRRLKSPLLCTVMSRAVHSIIFLLGMYLVLQIAGLTNVAFTIVGGTGLLGLILGIAFRDITENFLASMFLTLQQPFRTGDLIEIAGVTGLVQRLTARSTTMMTLEGNHIQIPNSTVYKSVIRNFTSNPNRREEFVVGIGFDDTISSAQEIALGVLRDHPAVLKDPEPWVLVDNLGKATVNLRIYFWLDGSRHSWLKVRSSVIRLIKRAFQEQGVSMPDEARELVFPKGVPVTLTQEARQHEPTPGIPAAAINRESELTAQPAEGGLSTELTAVEAQARLARIPEEGRNLLQETP
jgi:small conductance mechanosensitive channel